MQIKINGILAQLGDSYPSITKKSIDINEPSARFVDFTNKFVLPSTDINKEIFNSPYAIGSNNRSFNKLYSVSIFDVFEIFNGFGYLESSNSDTFTLQVIDQSKELFNFLNAKLNSISWDDKDTTLTQTSIDALDVDDITTCWFWGKACYHESAIAINTDQTTGDDRTKYSRPCFSFNGLLNRAIVNFGYTLTPSDLNLAVSTCHKQFYFTSYQKTLTGSFSPAGSVAIDNLDTNDFEHADIAATSTDIDISTNKEVFRLRGRIVSDFLGTIVFRATDNLDPTKISESKLILSIGENIVDFSTSEFYSADGYTIDIRIDGTGTATFYDTLLYTIEKDDSKDLSTNPWLNYKIKVYDNLPDYTYLDLFKTICVVYNKYQIVDSKEKTFAFGTFANISKLSAVDWSEKFIEKSEQITSGDIQLGQINYTKYTNDQTVNINHGRGSFAVDNEALPSEFDYIVLNFGASYDVTIGSNSVAHVRVYDTTGRIKDEIIPNVRLFQIVGDKCQFTPIDWNNLNELYYSSIFNSLYNCRQIAGEINLSKLDVLSWHEKQLCYIDYFKSAFIVQEISNFIPAVPTKVKLLRYGR